MRHERSSLTDAQGSSTPSKGLHGALSRSHTFRPQVAIADGVDPSALHDPVPQIKIKVTFSIQTCDANLERGC